MAEEMKEPVANASENESAAIETPPAEGRQSRPSEERTYRRRPRSGRKWALILGIPILLLAGGLLLWRYFSSYESTDDAQVDAHLYPVSARVSGYVVRVNVDDNQYVQKGAVLVEIDPRDYQVALDSARAELASAEATARSLNITIPITSVNTSATLRSSTSDVESSSAAILAAEKQLAASHAQLEEAQANDVRAQDDLARYKLLVSKQEISAQIYDQALASAKASAATVAAAGANEAAAEQTVRQARSHLAVSQAGEEAARTGPQQVASTRARVASAIATVEQMRAALEQAELNLQYTRILAPVSGEVTKTVVVGMNVTQGQQLLTIVPLQDVWITANFKETQLRRMRVGQKVRIYADSTGRTYRGRIDSIAGATGPLFSLLPPENATGNYVKIVQRVPVKIVLDPAENRDLQLRPGMNVEPHVYLQ